MKYCGICGADERQPCRGTITGRQVTEKHEGWEGVAAFAKLKRGPAYYNQLELKAQPNGRKLNV